MRGSLKQHRDVTSGQRPSRPATGLDLVGKIQHRAQLARFEIADVQEITAEKTAHVENDDLPDPGIEAA